MIDAVVELMLGKIWAQSINTGERSSSGSSGPITAYPEVDRILSNFTLCGYTTATTISPVTVRQ
jgi:hypothetical protein